jgi:hypothetical protein
VIVGKGRYEKKKELIKGGKWQWRIKKGTRGWRPGDMVDKCRQQGGHKNHKDRARGGHK